MVHLVLAAAITAAPSPSPTPLRTILHESVSPLCTALRENIGHAIQAVLADDQAIAGTKPVLVAMAHDYMSSSVVAQNGWGNLDGPVATDHDATAMQLDAQHLEQIVGALTHNLQLIDAQLSDANRFPKVPKTDADRKALEFKAQLEAIAAQQKQTLNVVDAMLETRNMEALANRGDPMEQLFGIDDLSPTQKGSPKAQGSNQQFNGGPLTATPAQQFDPSLKPSEYGALTNSVFGRYYRVVYLEQGAISSLEQPLAKNVVETTKRCSGNP